MVMNLKQYSGMAGIPIVHLENTIEWINTSKVFLKVLFLSINANNAAVGVPSSWEYGLLARFVAANLQAEAAKK